MVRTETGKVSIQRCHLTGSDGEMVCWMQILPLQRLCVGQRYENLWPDPAWTDEALEDFQKRRPDVVVFRVTTPTDW